MHIKAFLCMLHVLHIHVVYIAQSPSLYFSLLFCTGTLVVVDRKTLCPMTDLKLIHRKPDG